MFGSYLRVAALVCLAAAVGCSDEGTNGGNGGAPGAGGSGGSGGSAGAGGAAGEGGGGGMGGVGGSDPSTVKKAISLGCSNNVTEDISILEWELWVTPDGDVTGGATFDAELDGVAFFAESFLDAAQAAVPGGVGAAALNDLAATVLLRSGGSGDTVTLGPVELPYSCSYSGGSCDPANSQPNGSNTDCVPMGAFNPCLQFVDLPTSDDCGVCDGLGAPKDTQCAQNGFCVTGPLPLELEAQTSSYTADASGTMLFGWDDANTGATENPDGTYALPPAMFNSPTPPNGLRVTALLQVALQCTMAVDSGGPDGVDVPDQSSPTPDSALLEIPIL